jgi:hypothetical protein
MRRNARYTEGGCGSAALPAPGWNPANESHDLFTGFAGKDAKVDLTSLHPGGMTQEAQPGIAPFLHAGSPEPVIGYGGMKGISAYYQAVLHFGTLMEYCS